MSEVAQIRESAFHNIDHVDIGDYRDSVIKIEIHGRTVNDIDQVAEAAGLTSAQWIRATIAMELIRSTESGLTKSLRS